MNRKFFAAALAVAVALTGIVTGIRWLTVVALVLWIVAMLYFGVGDRKVDRPNTDSD